MAPKPDRFAFIFGMAVAVAMTILAITTWPSDSGSGPTTPIPSTETVYRPLNTRMCSEGLEAVRM